MYAITASHRSPTVHKYYRHYNRIAGQRERLVNTLASEYAAGLRRTMPETVSVVKVMGWTITVDRRPSNQTFPWLAKVQLNGWIQDCCAAVSAKAVYDYVMDSLINLWLIKQVPF